MSTLQTHVKIIPTKGELSLEMVHFRANVGDSPPSGQMHTDCVYSNTTSLSTEWPFWLK